MRPLPYVSMGYSTMAPDSAIVLPSSGVTGDLPSGCTSLSSGGASGRPSSRWYFTISYGAPSPPGSQRMRCERELLRWCTVSMAFLPSRPIRAGRAQWRKHRPLAISDLMLTLYFAPGSSSMAPHIALHEIGVPFEPRPLSFARMEQRSPEFLAINPEGKVPTLLIDGRPLTEVAGILFYPAKRFPETGLLPHGDVEAEAQAISWMSFIAATVHQARRLGVERGQEIYRVAGPG